MGRWVYIILLIPQAYQPALHNESVMVKNMAVGNAVVKHPAVPVEIVLCPFNGMPPGRDRFPVSVVISFAVRCHPALGRMRGRLCGVPVIPVGGVLFFRVRGILYCPVRGIALLFPAVRNDASVFIKTDPVAVQIQTLVHRQVSVIMEKAVLAVDLIESAGESLPVQIIISVSVIVRCPAVCGDPRRA